MSTWALNTSSDSNNSVKNTCWITVAVIIGILIFIFIVNDYFMKKKEYQEYKQQKNVKFYDEEDEEYEEKVVKKNRCSVNN
jgi:hypothetical protein